MHLVFLLNVVRRWQRATGRDERRSRAFTATLEQIARDGTVFASAGSEHRHDLARPATTATRSDDGWVVPGRKVFCTMSPAADVLYTAVTYIAFMRPLGCNRAYAFLGQLAAGREPILH